MRKNYDLAVFIARAQPFHNGHKYIIEEALKRADFVLVLVGSTDIPRSYRNPFTFDERRNMILDSFDLDSRFRIFVSKTHDHTYNDTLWVKDIQSAVNRKLENKFYFPGDGKKSVALVGHSKDKSSYYLKLFPMWESIDLPNHGGIDATTIREEFFLSGSSQWSTKNIPESVAKFLLGFYNTPEYKSIRDECDFVFQYKKAWEAAPYPPTFVTVDAVVVQSGHVLLVKRGAQPGKGLWAIPGGFLNQDERIEDAAIRELREETGIKVPVPVLKGSIVAREVFDDPNRSLRGRTITHAFGFRLRDDVSLPKVKGQDDAEKAKWMLLSDLKPDIFYEDHFHIITNIVSKM